MSDEFTLFLFNAVMNVTSANLFDKKREREKVARATSKQEREQVNANRSLTVLYHKPQTIQLDGFKKVLDTM